jgi:hypothetical protein
MEVRARRVAGEISEHLRTGVEVGGEPDAKAELREDDEAPGEHEREKERLSAEKFQATKCGEGEGESGEF